MVCFLTGHSVDTLALNLVGQTENLLFLIDLNSEKDLICFCYYHGSKTKKTVFIVVNNAFVPMDHHHQGAGAVSWSSQTRLTGFSLIQCGEKDL